jgi:hypothetical protein
VHIVGACNYRGRNSGSSGGVDEGACFCLDICVEIFKALSHQRVEGSLNQVHGQYRTQNLPLEPREFSKCCRVKPCSLMGHTNSRSESLCNLSSPLYLSSKQTHSSYFHASLLHRLLAYPSFLHSFRHIHSRELLESIFDLANCAFLVVNLVFDRHKLAKPCID